SGDRTPYRERTIDFITKFALFCGKSDNDGPVDTLNNRLLLRLFVFCMRYNECPNPAVRFRCVQIIHKLLEGIGENGVIPDELYQGLQDILLRRVQDVKSVVRVQAIQALSRMQDPTTTDCPAVESFIWLSRHDPTTEVRRAALAAMVLTTKTLPSLIERCRDVSDTVRRTAYKILTDRNVLRPLSIAKRIRILQDGLSDRSADVRLAAQELVLAWFRSSDSNPIKLLHRLDTEGVPETSQLLLDTLFTTLPEADFNAMVRTWAANYLSEQRTIKPEMLTPDAAFFWRALAEYLNKRRENQPKGNPHPTNDVIADDEESETNTGAVSPELIIPSASSYVDMTKILIDQLVQMVLAEEFDEKAMEQECIVEHVLRLALSLDLSDEFGRRRLVTLIHEWITSPVVPSTLSTHLLKVHALLEPNLRKRVNNVIEMISELCDPVEPQAHINSASEAPPCKTQAEGGSQQKDTRPVELQPTLSKDVERDIRLKIAKLEVQLNEVNESLHECVRRKEFERAMGLRDQCAQLESERSALLGQLHGENIKPAQETPNNQTKPDAKGEHSNSEAATEVKPGAPELEDDEDGEEKAAEDGLHNLLERCSAAVLQKANRLAALVVQQAPTLWRLPASLRSLLDSLVSCLPVTCLSPSHNVAVFSTHQHRLATSSCIFPSIQHSDPSVRNQAILTLGLCCSMDLPLAIQYLHLFYSYGFFIFTCLVCGYVTSSLRFRQLTVCPIPQAMRVDHVMISETALKCIIDCYLIYGFRPFHDAKVRPYARITTSKDASILLSEVGEGTDSDGDDDNSCVASDYIVLMRQNDQIADGAQVTLSNRLVRREEMSKTAARLLKPIVALLDNEDDDLRTTSALGLAKLLIYDRFVSSQVLSQLILLWFNPISEDRPAIRRGLACFFTDYACGNTANSTGSSASHDIHQAALTDAVLPTLSSLIRAPASSPLSEVEPADVAALLAHLTDTIQLKSAQDTQPRVQKKQQPVDMADQEHLEGEQPALETEQLMPNELSLNNPHHDRLALTLASEILKAPQSAEAKLYLRMLSQLHPSPKNVELHVELLLLSEAMFKFADRSSTLLLHRFRKQVCQSLEQLGLDPEKVLIEAKKAKAAEAGSQQTREDHENSASDSSNSIRDLDTTVLNDAHKRIDPNHPTLLGSARPNTHLLANANTAHEGGPTQRLAASSLITQSQLGRTLLGVSVLEKSGHHGTLLDFSESDESDVVSPLAELAEEPAKPTSISTTTTVRTKNHKPTRRVRIQPQKSQRMTRGSSSSAGSEYHDLEQHEEIGGDEEKDKENTLAVTPLQNRRLSAEPPDSQSRVSTSVDNGQMRAPNVIPKPGRNTQSKRRSPQSLTRNARDSSTMAASPTPIQSANTRRNVRRK
ncbi:HEAT repeat protein, partial [Opisthorchis viverrini]